MTYWIARLAYTDGDTQTVHAAGMRVLEEDNELYLEHLGGLRGARRPQSVRLDEVASVTFMRKGEIK